MSLTIKTPSGPATRHILASNGPPNYHLNFYSTNYSVEYSKRAKTSPDALRHKGTGYQANFRPTIYYKPEVDKVENPSLASLISDNYHTLTSRDYTAPTLHTGREHLPVTSSHALSGYAHNLPLTRQPLSKSLSSNTSYRNNYPKKDFRTHKADSGSNDLKEDTGFTHAYNVEPITFRPNECHVTNLPGHVTWRPTGQSLMKRDYVSCPPLGGQEPLATVTTHSCRSNGFIKGNNNPTQAQPINIKEPTVDKLHPLVIKTKSKQDPAMFSVSTHPHPYTAYSTVTHPPHKLRPYMDEDENGIGKKKEVSGYVDNTLPKLANNHPTDSKTIFRECYHGNNLVTYPPPPETERLPYPDGFTKSTRVHDHGNMPNGEQVLTNLKPYVARSKLCSDPCYLDYTHHHKLHNYTPAAVSSRMK